MGRLTREQLRKLREEKARAWRRRDAGDRPVEVVIGMATCGIAAGAKATFDAFRDELERNHLEDVEIRQTGCMGLCHAEPTVEVAVEGMPTVVYGRVDGEVARRIVRKHIIGRLLINDHIFDRPAADIVAAPGPAKE